MDPTCALELRQLGSSYRNTVVEQETIAYCCATERCGGGSSAKLSQTKPKGETWLASLTLPLLWMVTWNNV